MCLIMGCVSLPFNQQDSERFRKDFEKERERELKEPKIINPKNYD